MKSNVGKFLLIAVVLLVSVLLATAGVSFAGWGENLTPDSSLSYSPTSLTTTVNLGDTVSQTLTLEATGDDPVEVTLTPYTTLMDRVYGIYATFTDPHVAHFQHDDPGVLTDMGIFANGSPGGDFFGDDFSRVYAIANNDPFNAADDSLVAIDTTTGAVSEIGPLGAPAGFEAYGAMAYDPVSKKMYAVSSYVDFFGTGGNTLYTVDIISGQATQLGALVSPNARQIDGMSFDGEGNLYGQDLWNQELVQINLDSMTFTAIGVPDVFPEFNTGMDWDPVTNQMYMTMWRSVEGGELRTIDLTTAQTTLVGSLGSVVPGTPEGIAFTWLAFASAPSPWLKTTPEEITVPADGTATVDLILNTQPLYQPGSYQGYIAFSGTFEGEVATMPITMQVDCADCGVLNGTFSDAWSNVPVNAQLHITSTAGMDIELAYSPGYSVTVPAGSYTLVASADGYLDETVMAMATNGGTTTTNVALVPEAGLLEVGVTAVEVTAEIGDVVTQTITVSNTGTIPLTFRPRLDNLDVPVRLQHATLAAIKGEQRDGLAPDEVLTIEAYGINHPDAVGGELAWFDLANADEVWSSDAYHDHGSMMGGDFFGDDFSKLYSFEESRLIALDTASGEKTYIGALPLISGFTSYNNMAYDPVSEAMYFIYAYDCGAPPYILYQVDVETAAVSAIGELTDSGCIGAAAFDDTGRLYGIDIDNNVLVEIDPATADVTVIGAIGFDVPTFEQGMDWDPATDQMYFTAVDVAAPFPFPQKLYLLDLFSGEATYLVDIGATIPGPGGANVAGLAIQSEAIQWATLPAEAITIPVGQALTFDLVFDTRSIYRTGDYQSDLLFDGTFINSVAPVPVTLHLSCTNCGTLTGAITEADGALPLPADLHITGPDGFEVSLSHKSSYTLTVRPGEYTVSAESNGYVGDSATVNVTTNGATTADFALVPYVPDIALTPTTFYETVAIGAVVTRTFTIENSGTAGFDFTVLDVDLDATSTAPNLESCGGTDGFGYACIDSDAAGGPAYNWVDISASGQSLGLDGANDYYGMLELPFAFDYYGASYDEIAISSYGQVYFENRMADPEFLGNQPIPSTISADGVQTFIAPYWDSLNYDQPNNPQTFYEIQGVAPHRRLVIQWNNVTANWTYPITFQVILFEDSGNILMQYESLNGDTGEFATVGIQGDETTGLEYSYNTAALSDHLAICYVHPDSTNYTCNLDAPDASWLTETAAESSVAAGESVTVTVVFDTAGLTNTGMYHAEIYLGGTDNDPYVIPVTMEVVEASYQIYLPVLARQP
jgi:hypothetical protein